MRTEREEKEKEKEELVRREMETNVLLNRPRTEKIMDAESEIRRGSRSRDVGSSDWGREEGMLWPGPQCRACHGSCPGLEGRSGRWMRGTSAT